MNRPVDKAAITAALAGLPFTLSEHDEGGGITATFGGSYVDADRYIGQAMGFLKEDGLHPMRLEWCYIHIASPDVGGQPLRSDEPGALGEEDQDPRPAGMYDPDDDFEGLGAI